MAKTTKSVKQVKPAKQAKPRTYVAPIFLKQDALHAQREMERQASLREAFDKAGVTTFVSTSMCVLTKGENHALDEIVYDNGAPHYRLTPLFWAWLHHTFDNATRACETGKLEGTIYKGLLDRISRVYNIAVEQYGTDALKFAEQTFTPANGNPGGECVMQYKNATDILPEDLINEIRRHFPGGMLWVPENGADHRERDDIIVTLVKNDVPVNEVASLARMTPRHVRRIVRNHAISGIGADTK